MPIRPGPFDIQKTRLILDPEGSATAKAVVTKTPLRGMSRRFVPGESVDDLVRAVKEANAEVT